MQFYTQEPSLEGKIKEIEIIHRLFLVIAMYCRANSSQFNQSLNLPCYYLAGHNSKGIAVGSNSLETTYILFKLPLEKWYKINGLIVGATLVLWSLISNLKSRIVLWYLTNFKIVLNYKSQVLIMSS